MGAGSLERRHGARVHLHLPQARPLLPARPHGAGEHLALVLPGRQDRRHRVQRRRQVEPAQDHGRPRRRLSRRGPPHARLHRRLPRPGAAARPGQGRQGQRHGRRRRGAVDHRPLQRGHGDVGRARRRLRQDRRPAGRARGQDRGRRRVEPRAQRRDRHGRPALPARRRRRHRRSRAASGAASPCAACCSAGPTCCCSTSRPTTSTPRASTGSSSSSRTTRAPSWPSPTTATSSTTSPSGSSSSTAARASRSRATTRRGSSRSRSAWPASRAATRPAGARSSASWSGCAWRPKARQAKGKARLAAYDKLQAEAEADRGDDQRLEIAIPPGPRLGDTVIEVDGLRKGFGDRLLIEDLSFSLPQAGIVGIIGPNGAGKTTLFKMLTGQEPVDAGIDQDRRHRRS